MNKAMEILKPILALGIVCLAITAGLAVTNYYTAPIIANQGSEEANAVRKEILPDADDFEKVDISDDIVASTGVYECYKATNGIGSVISQNAKGYAGEDTLNIMYSYSADGALLAVKVVSSQETPGLGSRATEESYLNAFVGKNSNMTFTLVKGAASSESEISVISGASISSNAIVDAVNQANMAFKSLKEAGLIE